MEEIGQVKNITSGRDSALLQIEAERALSDARPGDSIAVNGACLTVTGIAGGAFTADVMNETLAKTNLGLLRPGSPVNLERALSFGGRLGGHLVAGHVDATGAILSLQSRGIATEMWVAVPGELERLMIPQGSVALDGVSLTIASLKAGALMVALIPHTRETTTLGGRRPGDILNMEADLLGKYVSSLLQRDGNRDEQGVTRDLLLENGFL